MSHTCCSGSGSSPAPGAAAGCPLDHFKRIIPNCLAYAREQHAAGRPIVGILCEFAPRELILAAGAVPVCLCGGAASTIPAAEAHLPTALCPLIKSTFGYSVLRNNPFVEMASLIVAETTCDGKKKMMEILAESRPVHVLEMTQKEGDPDALAHWTAELRKLRAALEERLGARITDKAIRAAVRLMNRERRLRRELAALMRAERPPLTGRQLLDLKSSISGIEMDLAQYERALALLGPKAVKADAELSAPSECKSTDSECKSAASVTAPSRLPVRVLLTGVPLVHGAERVLDLIESHGGVAVCMENCTGLKPILDDVDENASDPLRALAEKYFGLPCSVQTPNAKRLRVLRDLARDYRPECVIELVWQGCLTYATEARRVRRLAEEELEIPYLKIETDYSPSDSASITLRIEALFETVLSRRA